MNRQKYYIGIMLIIGAVALYVTGYKMGQSFEGNIITYDNRAEEADRVDEPVIKKNTEYILETYNLTTGERSEEYMDIPLEFMGLTRLGLINFIDEHKDYFGGENERVSGVMLLSFSEKSIAIRRNLETVEETTEAPVVLSDSPKYYIFLTDGNIVVYKEDKTTVYMETGITKEELEPSMISELKNGISVKNISELYRLLESFTS